MAKRSTKTFDSKKSFEEENETLPATVTEYEFAPIDSLSDKASTPIAGEYALTINYNGISDAVMMISPDHLDDFLIGFTLTHGIIEHPSQIRQTSVSVSGGHLSADITLSPRAEWSLKRRRKLLMGNSGCGLCGEEALEHILEDLTTLPPSILPQPQVFNDFRLKLTAFQSSVNSSGARHAAFYCSANGEVLLCREDIGRHNALDKLIGAMTNCKESDNGFVVLTSRCGLELVQKAVKAKISTLVTLSSPTTMAVDWARTYQLNLIHLPHHSTPRVYSGNAIKNATD